MDREHRIFRRAKLHMLLLRNSENHDFGCVFDIQNSEVLTGAHQLAVADDAILACKSHQNLFLFRFEVKNANFTHTFLEVVHPEQTLGIEVERHGVLGELETLFKTEFFQAVVLQVRETDRGQIHGHLLVLLLLDTHIEHAVVVLVEEGEGAFTLGLVCAIVLHIHDQHVVHDAQIIGIQLLARDITD